MPVRPSPPRATRPAGVNLPRGPVGQFVQASIVAVEQTLPHRAGSGSGRPRTQAGTGKVLRISATRVSAVTPANLAWGSSTRRWAMTRHSHFLDQFRGHETKAVKQGQCLGRLHQGQGGPGAGPKLDPGGGPRGSHQIHHVFFQLFTDDHGPNLFFKVQYFGHGGAGFEVVQGMARLLVGQNGPPRLQGKHNPG